MATELVPHRAEAIAALLVRLSTKLPTYATALGVTAPELASVTADAAMLVYLGRLTDAARTYSPAVTAYRDTLISGAESPVGAIPVFTAPATPPAVVTGGLVARTRRLLQKIRASVSFTEAIAADLGLPTASESSVAPDPLVRPELLNQHAVTLPGIGVSIPWIKGKHSGIAVIAQRGESNTAPWESLGDDLFSPFIDKRPSLIAGQPETRRYRLQYKDNDELIGQLSDIIVVTVPG